MGAGEYRKDKDGLCQMPVHPKRSRVEGWRGAVGQGHLFPPLSVDGASLPQPWSVSTQRPWPRPSKLYGRRRAAPMLAATNTGRGDHELEPEVDGVRGDHRAAQGGRAASEARAEVHPGTPTLRDLLTDEVHRRQVAVGLPHGLLHHHLA